MVLSSTPSEPNEPVLVTEKYCKHTHFGMVLAYLGGDAFTPRTIIAYDDLNLTRMDL
jgi:hypothetical protein